LGFYEENSFVRLWAAGSIEQISSPDKLTAINIIKKDEYEDLVDIF
jgi:HEAT repeat protein